MRALRKDQAAAFNLTRDMCGEARPVERAFGIAPCSVAEAMAILSEQMELKAA